MIDKKETKKRIIPIKGFDGSIVFIEVTKMYPLKDWTEGKCWAIWCNNPFYFIHLNRNNRATHAYCFHLFKSFPKLKQKGEKWCHIEKGELVIDGEKK